VELRQDYSNSAPDRCLQEHDPAVITDAVADLVASSFAVASTQHCRKHYWEVELLSKSHGEIVGIDCYLCFDILYVLVLGIFIGITAVSTTHCCESIVIPKGVPPCGGYHNS
jgi:hypothetical protein